MNEPMRDYEEEDRFPLLLPIHPCQLPLWTMEGRVKITWGDRLSELTRPFDGPFNPYGCHADGANRANTGAKQVRNATERRQAGRQGGGGEARDGGRPGAPGRRRRPGCAWPHPAVFGSAAPFTTNRDAVPHIPRTQQIQRMRHMPGMLGMPLPPVCAESTHPGRSPGPRLPESSFCRHSMHPGAPKSKGL